jgi:FKBP-type peptidyl-prolyl cis-trans isomerase SlpA
MTAIASNPTDANPAPQPASAVLPLVEAGSFLTLRYRLSGPDGVSIINTFDGPPATLSLGTGDLSAVLEQHLLGLAEGAHATFEIPAGAAFGERSPDMQQWVARSLLATLGDPHEVYDLGDVVQFPPPQGRLGAGGYAGVVRAVEAQRVLFDFNHPLAGLAVQFEVKVIGVL